MCVVGICLTYRGLGRGFDGWAGMVAQRQRLRRLLLRAAIQMAHSTVSQTLCVFGVTCVLQVACNALTGVAVHHYVHNSWPKPSTVGWNLHWHTVALPPAPTRPTLAAR